MRGEELQSIRVKMGLSRRELAAILGYSGDVDQINKTIRRYEQGRRPIPFLLARLAWIIWVYYRSTGEHINWPNGIDIQSIFIPKNGEETCEAE